MGRVDRVRMTGISKFGSPRIVSLIIDVSREAWRYVVVVSYDLMGLPISKTQLGVAVEVWRVSYLDEAVIGSKTRSGVTSI